MQLTQLQDLSATNLSDPLMEVNEMLTACVQLQCSKRAEINSITCETIGHREQTLINRERFREGGRHLL